MAYDPENPPSLIAQGVGGTSGLRWFALMWVDPIADVLVPGYISNAADLGMRPGDGLIYKDTNRGEWDHYDLIVLSVDGDGAATVAFPEVPEEAYPAYSDPLDPSDGAQVIILIDGRQYRVPISQAASAILTGNGVLALEYERPETGAVPIPISDKFHRTITVEEFGAVGDGVFNPATGEYDGTDDTAAIMAALDALQTNGLGGTVYFDPAKVYVCSSSTSRVGGSLTRTLELYGDNITLAGGGLIAFKGSHGANWRCLMVGGAGKVAAGTGNIEEQRCVDKAGVAITAPIAQGSIEVTVASGDEAGFAAGDVAFIRSGQVLTAGLTEPNAELAIVAGTGVGKVFLTKPTSKPYEQEYFISGTSGRTTSSVTANPARFEIVNVTDRVTRGVRFDGVRLFNRTGGLQLLSTWGVMGGDFDVELVEYPYLGWGHRDCTEFVHEVRLHHNGENNVGYGWHPSTGCTRYRGTVDQTSEGFNYVNLHEACADMTLHVRSRNVGGFGELLAGFSLNARGYDLNIHLDIDVGVSTLNAFQALYFDGEDLSGVTVWLDNVRGKVRDDTARITFKGLGDVGGLVSLRGAQLDSPLGHESEIIVLSGWATADKPTLSLGVVPEEGMTLWSVIQVFAAFNSGTTTRLSVGYSGNTTAYVNQAIVNAVGTQRVDSTMLASGPSMGFKQTADREVIVTAPQDATLGAALVLLAWCPTARRT